LARGKSFSAGPTRTLDQAAAHAPCRGDADGRRYAARCNKDGHRMNTGNEGRDSKLLTRTGLDWSNHYRRTNEALAKVAR
jgi:hypothetical protein